MQSKPIHSSETMNHSFPVISSILSTDALTENVLPGFAIGEVYECKFFSAGFNHTYRVTTKTGRIYYLRVYRNQWRTFDDIRYELDLLNYLHRQGFPAAQPIQYMDGKYYHRVSAPEGYRYVALFTEAPGNEISYEHEPEQIALRYGQAVARMHDITDDFTSTFPRFHLDMAHFIDQPLSNIKPFLEDQPEHWAYIQHFANTLRKHLLMLPTSNLEQGFCHGDLQGYHARMDPSGRLTYFDFDCGGYGYRAYDLAVFLWCCRLEDAILTRWEPFLDGYRATRSIDNLDVQAVPLFVCARYLWHMGVHTQNSTDWGIDFLNEKYFKTHLQRLREAEADYLK